MIEINNTNLLVICAKMADCLHYLRSVRFFHADNINNPDLNKALEIGEKVHADLLALSGDNWIGVNAELPSKDNFYLVYQFNGHKDEYATTIKWFSKKEQNFLEWDFQDKVTHWQYLPQPPKE